MPQPLLKLAIKYQINAIAQSRRFEAKDIFEKQRMQHLLLGLRLTPQLYALHDHVA